ncbi:MAG: hypothetical protein IPJ37_20015 [Bacteroidales bacterium]|nr:hypothetical protein [Bacteroidales bacterium]
MQKVLFSLLFTFGCLSLNAQAPEGFGYNAVVRNTSGDPVADQAVSFFFSIIRGSAAGSVVYSEKHNVTTDNFGFVSLVIGNGTDTIGTFAAIAWGADKYFLKVELDNTGGTAYSDMGTTQFFSVPYSLYSKTAGNGFSGDYRDLTHKPLTNGSETRVIASNNITVSGAGTSANPYVIGNSPR